MGYDKPESELAELRSVILNYLHNNPNAADSLEGVISWWLPRTRQKVNVTRVEQALEQLFVEGLVNKLFLVDGTILYRKEGRREDEDIMVEVYKDDDKKFQ